ncbi:hypothetical protein KY285_007882 [Solanum tuberosum]|nr:hypothetical protein KY285_007882 [Solanum tuberosum]
MAKLAFGQPPIAGQTLPLYSDTSFPILQHPKVVSLNPKKLPKVPNRLSAKEDNNVVSSQMSLVKINYADLIKDSTPQQRNHGAMPPIPIKKIQYVEGVPRITWTEEEVDKMNVIENL